MRVTLLRFTETDEWCVRNTKFLLVLRSLGSGNNQLSRAHLDQLRGRGRSTNCARSLHVCLTPNSSPPGYPFAPGVVELDRPPALHQCGAYLDREDSLIFIIFSVRQRHGASWAIERRRVESNGASAKILSPI